LALKYGMFRFFHSYSRNNVDSSLFITPCCRPYWRPPSFFARRRHSNVFVC